MTRTPTSHEIAVAIVTAARRYNADPIDVAEGMNDPPGDGRKAALHSYPISRARTYAAFGLALAFPDLNDARIARWCGASKNGSYSFFSNKRGTKWFDPAEAEPIASAIRAGAVPQLTQDSEKGDPVVVERGTPKTHDARPSPPVMTHSSAPAPVKSSAPAIPKKPIVVAAPMPSGRFPSPIMKNLPVTSTPWEGEALERRAGERGKLNNLLQQAILNTGGKLVGE